MKVLITGACGFIGRNLIRELEVHHELRLLDQTPPAAATIFAGATRTAIPLESDWPFIQADITDAVAMRQAMVGMDAVIHLAGEPRGLPEIGVETFRANAFGTFVAIDAAHTVGIQRFFCASSINAYGTFFGGLAADRCRTPSCRSMKPLRRFPKIPIA
ncbi:MAG: NAD(P)-dependent oxidoreductase [Caldilineaceae bacterium]